MHPQVPEEVKRGVELVAEAIRSRFGERVVFVRLFGSWARGEARPDSDVDVAVAIRALNSAEEREASWLAASAGSEHGVTALILGADEFEQLHGRELLIAQDIEREGIPF